ncbi:PLP-dependent aminotransferase family protein [Mycetocola tolaasinivorans]|uniref:PLP-dependent aminotransferase family protein n=1 Tax=Mycetocola tolaasinivorans TaxID=76635 RepID=A0A3L7A427_9MICO|nr:PLP-dependent aminotransferase family protein [Mycetocola tolaasinivorans]RLP75049.1 PLP-dependent aminotransferase family protein [Mycetocola tolaasinivorans]
MSPATPLPVSPARLVRELGDWQRPDQPTYRALAARIRLLLLDGRLAVDTRLPAERDLGARLGVSRNTIAAAYAALREAGYLTSVRGSGSRLCLPGGARGGADLGRTSAIDFRRATFTAYPGITDLYAEAVERIPAHIEESGYDIHGLPMLREAVAAHYVGRGIPTTSEQIIVTSGAQHALHLVTRALIRPGERVLIEHPSYAHAFDTLISGGARLLPQPIEPGGWDISATVDTLRRTRPAAGYVMPDFQNPSGASLAEEDRRTLARAATQSGTTLIVDETTSWLDIDRGERTGLAAFSGDVVTLGSLGKVVWGAMRIGWIRAPRPLVDRILAARSAVDLGTAILEQIVATLALRDIESVLGFRRTQLRDSRDHLVSLIREHFPEWTPHVVDGGMSLWQHTGQVSTLALADAARAEGLAIIPGTRFGVDGAFDHHLRLPFGYTHADLTAGVLALRRAADAVGSPSAQRRAFDPVV